MTPRHEQVRKLVEEWYNSQSRPIPNATLDDLEDRIERLISELTAETAGEPVVFFSDHANPSPTNACIRAAKRVIAALNLPEGAGVAYDEGWKWFEKKPRNGNDCWIHRGGSPWGDLPTTAIPTWPGDFRDSFITLNTSELP